jgi:hypothetical protein
VCAGYEAGAQEMARKRMQKMTVLFQTMQGSEEIKANRISEKEWASAVLEK